MLSGIFSECRGYKNVVNKWKLLSMQTMVCHVSRSVGLKVCKRCAGVHCAGVQVCRCLGGRAGAGGAEVWPLSGSQPHSGL